MDKSRSVSPAEQVLRDAVASRFGKAERKSEPVERRPSIVVNEDGCIVQRGFVIPNRSSSSHSRSRQMTSTSKPINAFPRPTGALFHAPEFRPLTAYHTNSLHRPTKSAGDLDHLAKRTAKPSLGERRQTWQSGVGSSMWTEDELVASLPRRDSRQMDTRGRQRDPKPMHRSRAVDGDLQALGNEQSKKQSAIQQQGAVTQTKKDIKHVPKAEAEDAIASDSDEDSESPKQGIALAHKHPNRVSYAARRLRQDERAAEEFERRVAERDAEPEPSTAQHINLMRSDQYESAIESDSEDEDDKVICALRTAKIHRAHNQLATSQGASEPQNEEEGNRTPRKSSEKRASLSVKITPEPMTAIIDRSKNTKDGVTPREIQCFEKGAPTKCRKLRPSKSRPRPRKGVLKKSGSPSPPSSSSSSSPSESPSKHVHTVKRQSFASICKDVVSAPLTYVQSYWQAPGQQQQVGSSRAV